MTQKVIEVVGTSKESFAKAELEMELDGKKIVKYRTTTKIYFDIEK